MKKVVINRCYSDSFDISQHAKDVLRAQYGIIFDPIYTPRDDPALVRVVEQLGEEACVFHEDYRGVRTYLTRPVVMHVPYEKFEIVSCGGNEMIQCLKKRMREDDEACAGGGAKRKC